MSDERRQTAVALPGEPADWRATVRDLLRYLRAVSREREAARQWLLEETATSDPDVADEQLAFLEVTEIVEAAEGRLKPGAYGSAFLDTHDEAALYEALTSAVRGFEPLLESLAVRPLTDVEFVDLLEREFETDPWTTDSVRAHRQWLQALGYVDHADGVNDLTQAGRRRVETDDDLTPPRVNRGAGSEDAEEVAPSLDTAAEASRSGDAPASDTDDRFEALKRRYDHTCMVCGDRRQRSLEEGYARVYHPMPTDDGHGGPAEPANAVVVCPNHHADLERGLLRIDPRTHEIDHAYESSVAGRTLETVDGHDLGSQYLAYHDEVVAEF